MADGNLKRNPGEPISSPVNQMISLDVDELAQRDIYKILTGAIVPRPIAFVSTCNREGHTNLAPFSAFNLVASNPATLVFSVANDNADSEKDTLRNIRETEEFVVNSANVWHADSLVQASAKYPPEVSEIDELGYTPLQSQKVKPPRIKESAIHFECKLYKLVPIGDGEIGSSHLVVGEIVYVHLDERCYQDGKIDIDALQPLSRVGGPFCRTVGEELYLPRPKALSVE